MAWRIPVQMVTPRTKFILFLLALAALLLLCVGICQASWPWDACCAVRSGNAGGSGTLVGVSGEQSLVITAHHVIEGGGRRSVRFPGREWQPAQLVGSDSRNDIAALVTRTPEGIGTPRGYRAAAKEDGPFVMIGYPWYGRGKREVWQGDYNGYTSWGTVLVRGRGHIQSGYSGGMTLNRYAEYVGPCNGFTDYGSGVSSYATSGDAMTRFVDRFLRSNQ